MKVLEYKMAQEAKALIEEPKNFRAMILDLDNSLNPDDFMIKLIPAIGDSKKQTYLGARLIFQPKEREKDPSLWEEWFTELEVNQVNGTQGLWLNTLRGCRMLCALDTKRVRNWKIQLQKFRI